MAAKKYKLKSSNLKSMTYDSASKELVVSFKNGTSYRYSKVPSAVARAIRKNKSAGKTFNKRIKMGKYQYEKVAFVRGFFDELEKDALFAPGKHPVMGFLKRVKKVVGPAIFGQEHLDKRLENLYWKTDRDWDLARLQAHRKGINPRIDPASQKMERRNKRIQYLKDKLFRGFIKRENALTYARLAAMLGVPPLLAAGAGYAYYKRKKRKEQK